METSKRTFKLLLAGMAAAFALCLGALALVGCSQGAEAPSTAGEAQDNAPAAPAAYTFTDDLGNEVTVDNPERVVACMGSFANTWELAGGTLVGASDDAFASYEIASPDVAKVGDFSTLNLESIIALEPDFVIMTGASTGRDGMASQVDLKESLEASGIAVAYFNVTTFEDYLRMLRTCCDITGRDDLYEKNGQAAADEVEAVKASVPEGEAPSVLLMTTYSGGTRVQNSSTMTGIMLSELGGKNLADENQSLLKDFSFESVIELDPDVILVVPMGNDEAAAEKALQEQTEQNPAWSTLTAVENGRYHVLSPKLFQYKPNDNWADSYQTLYEYLYQ